MVESECSTSQLPSWDLSRGFGWKSWDDAEVPLAMDEFEQKSKTFHDQYKGNLKTQLEASVKDYDKLETLKLKLKLFLVLNFNVDGENSELVRFRTVVEAKLSKIEADHLTFYSLEVANLSDDEVRAQMSSGLAFYTAFLRSLRKLRPHLLSQEVERALTLRAPWASALPMVQDLDRRTSNAKFNFKGETLNLQLLISKTLSPDPLVRREALKCINEGFASTGLHQMACLTYNAVAGSACIENAERHYKTPRSKRNLQNDIPDEVVESLLSAVKAQGIELGKRYYLLKKRIFSKTQGVKEFTWADRNAPLALKTGEKTYTWDEAVDIVSAAYNKFSPTLGKLFKKQVDEKRIHAALTDGKKGGAECEGIAPGVGPYQFLSFDGTSDAVQTLAHESGHGVHFLLSYVQGTLQYDPSIAIAEVASMFGEMIVWRDLLDKCDTDEERLAMLLEKIDMVVNAIVRQCSFDRFENLVHDARAEGVIDDDDFDKLWMQATIEYYGKEGEVFDKYEDTNRLWVYITHLFEHPYYVYGYAFADLVVGALYSNYMKEPAGFETNLVELLRAGSTKTFVECLQPFNLFPAKPEFWIESLQVHLQPLLEQAEHIAEKLYGK